MVHTGTTTSFTLGRLLPLTDYYWQVAASDGLATNTGPLWTFRTETGTIPLALLSGYETMLNREFQFHLDGVFGLPYTVQVSPNVIHWTELTTLTRQTGLSL